MLLREFAECECRTADEINRQIYTDANGSSFRFDKHESNDGFLFQANAARLRDISLVWFSSNKLHDITSGSRDEIRQIYQLKGRSRWRWGALDQINDPGMAGCLVPPDTASDVRNEADSEGLSVRIEPLALTTKLSALIGEPRIDLQFDYTDRNDSDKMAALQRAAVQLAIELDDAHRNFLDRSILNELSQAFIVRFLLTHPHNYSHRFHMPEGRLAKGQVRRIEDYLIAHWDKPLTIEDAVADLQVSARTIFRALRKSRGCSPMMFVRNVRLEKARAMLMNADHTTSVLTIASRCGFQSFGHFARNYRERYGELPSNTLRRSFRSARA